MNEKAGPIVARVKEPKHHAHYNAPVMPKEVWPSMMLRTNMEISSFKHPHQLQACLEELTKHGKCSMQKQSTPDQKAH
jgi:hypothetical protein